MVTGNPRSTWAASHLRVGGGVGGESPRSLQGGGIALLIGQRSLCLWKLNTLSAYDCEARNTGKGQAQSSVQRAQWRARRPGMQGCPRAAGGGRRSTAALERADLRSVIITVFARPRRQRRRSLSDGVFALQSLQLAGSLALGLVSPAQPASLLIRACKFTT